MRLAISLFSSSTRSLVRSVYPAASFVPLGAEARVFFWGLAFALRSASWRAKSAWTAPLPT